MSLRLSAPAISDQTICGILIKFGTVIFKKPVEQVRIV